MSEAHDGRREAVKQILAYFLSNPEAADNLEGIARWRLLESMVQRSLDETEEALRWLVAEGYLRIEEVPGSKGVFMLNPAKTAQAERLLGANRPEK